MSLIKNSSSNSNIQRLRCNIPPQLPNPSGEPTKPKIPFFLLFREKGGRLALFAFIFAFLAFPAFAQQPDPEAEFKREFDSMQKECQRISMSVPCSIGISQGSELPATLAKADNDALIKLALSVQTFISFNSHKDSSYIVEGKISNKENMLLSNSATVRQHYVKLSGSNGEYYRAIVLKSLGVDKSLYEEAKASTAAAENTSAVPQLPSKTTLKQAASKTAPMLLNIGKRALGLP
jgi:hypothetical protein